MSRARLHAALPSLLLVLVAAAAMGADWPQWRGPDRNGRSPETGLLGEWPAEGPPLAWQASGLGSGYSSLAVVGERIYTLGDLSAGQHVLALSRKDGSILWKTRIGPVWENRYLGPRSTPTFDDGHLFALSTEGRLVCLEAATGKLAWSRSLPEEFAGQLMLAQGTTDWRFSESPLVDGDRVVVTPGGPDAAMVALDKRTGKEIWRATIPPLGDRGLDGAGYSSVVVSEAAGIRQYIQLLGRGVVGVEASSGRFLWGYNRVANDIANIATPLVDGEHVFVSTGYGTGSALLRLTKSETGISATEVYWLEAEKLQNHHGGLILNQGVVYTGTGHNKGFPIAVSFATGKVAWGPERNAGQNSAAVTFADGKLYFRYQNGIVILVEASADAYRERGSFEIPNVEQFSWSHPVIAGGHLFLREQDRLYVYDVRQNSPAADTAQTP